MGGRKRLNDRESNVNNNNIMVSQWPTNKKAFSEKK